jgi:hypothetical protein
MTEQHEVGNCKFQRPEGATISKEHPYRIPNDPYYLRHMALTIKKLNNKYNDTTPLDKLLDYYQTKLRVTVMEKVREYDSKNLIHYHLLVSVPDETNLKRFTRRGFKVDIQVCRSEIAWFRYMHKDQPSDEDIDDFHKWDSKMTMNLFSKYRI